MLKSMTGYGIARCNRENLAVTVELKGVNSKQLDCNLRLPRGFLAADLPMRGILQERIVRGRIEVNATVDTSDASDTVVQVNGPLADAYAQALRELAQREHLEELFSVTELARLPEVLTVTKRELDTNAVTDILCETLRAAMDGFCAMRCKEGEKLKADLLSCLDRLEALVTLVEAQSPQTVEAYRVKMEHRLQSILADRQIDESRIVTEAAIFADKIATAEETVRLRSHIGQFRGLLEAEEPVGKTCDNLAQEMNREANTIGSKCVDLEITKYVLRMKSEIEKIREQIQNVE